MTSKRKNEGNGINGTKSDIASTSTQRKKARLDEARKITIQSSAPLAAGRNTSSMEGLPSTVDVEKFAEARAFEINAMQEAVNNVASAGTQRVWQSLPRHLRRRAASHDVRYVPARLRQKARAEMDTSANSKSRKKLPRRGTTKRETRTEELLKRQQDKTWLETHIWHAKRMHMENMWGYRLAKTPTEKSFRPSHRASVHGCILHDASYEAIIELKGPEETLREILMSCSDPQEVSPGAARFINGSRVCYTHMYKPKAYPFDLVGPVEVLWKALTVSPASPARSQAESKGKKNNQKESTLIRAVWIRCHPVIYDGVMSTITYSIQACLQAAQSTSKKEMNVEVTDLRNQFNIFELVGPKSSQVIHGALSPIKNEDRDEFKKFWQALGQLQTAASAPRGMVIGLRVLDPRLNFPPKNTKVNISEKTNETTKVPVGLWPTTKLATTDIWDSEVREKLNKPRYKKKDIDERKSKYLVPGSKLDPLRQDNRVPVLLIQRSIEPQVSSSSSSNVAIQPPPSSTRPLHGWTLIVPKGWGMPFFSSLTYTGTRVAGQSEIATQRFEAGCSMFPMDYPCTEAYTTHITERGEEEKEGWERKPPAKRPNWEKLGTEHPWVPDWEDLLGLRKKEPDLEINKDLVPTQRNASQESAKDREEASEWAENIERKSGDAHSVQPWLFRGPEIRSTIESLSHSPNPAPDLLARLNTWRGKRSLPPLSLPATSLIQSALVNVRLSMPRSGAPEDNAIIYEMDDEEARKWRSLVGENGESEFTETQLSELKYSKDSIVGYVTSGHYSLSIGRGQAIGALTFTSYLSMKEQLYRLGKPRSLPLVKIRNKDSALCRAALVELLC